MEDSRHVTAAQRVEILAATNHFYFSFCDDNPPAVKPHIKSVAPLFVSNKL